MPLTGSTEDTLYSWGASYSALEGKGCLMAYMVLGPAELGHPQSSLKQQNNYESSGV